MPGKRKREKKKRCFCNPHCGEILSARTRRRHYRAASSSMLPSESDSDASFEPSSESENDNNPSHNIPNKRSRSEPHDDGELSDSDASSKGSAALSEGRDNMTDSDSRVVDFDDHEEFSAEEDDVAHQLNSLIPEEEEDFEIDGWKAYDEVRDADTPISREEMIRKLEEMIGPEREEDLWEMRNDVLSEEDRDNIRAFKLKMMSNMSREVFEEMRYTFDHKLDISSEWVILHRVAILSCVEPVWYHCCVNACMAYTGSHSSLSSCDFCPESRYTPSGKPRRLFCYVPIIPRLQGFFRNPKMVERLLYRNQYKHTSETIADVFDSVHYRTLRQQNVVVDDKELSHKYFSGKYDIALGVCLDGYLLFKRNRAGPSATPILLQLYSLPPEIRTHLEYLMCAGMIPGTPKDVHSYLTPYDDELAQLAEGVPTFDSLTKTQFPLRAYNILEMGDIIAMEKMLNITGHNGYCPCRSCEIKGTRNVTAGDTIYYVPLTAPLLDGQPRRSWNPRNLPGRSHESFAEVAEKLDECTTVAGRKRISRFYGIKGLPALRRVGSTHFGKSAPWDLMHLGFENNAPNLYKLWSGKYKGLDTGAEDYEIPDAVWEIIWKETADAVRHIPADFVRVLGGNPAYFTAEAWCFWIVYLAPALLKGRFRHPKYHVHLCQYSDIIKRCIGFQITYKQIDELENNIIDWVRKYEEYYYQYDEARLSACPLTIHGLLHIADDIRFCGPSWATWTFWMERYCGYLQSGLRSRRYPWANLNNRLLRTVHLEQLRARYDLEKELSTHRTRSKSTLSRSEHTYDDYPQAVLRAPYKKNNVPDELMRKRIAAYFSAALGKRQKDLKPKLPEVMPQWGKVRIVDGDSVRSVTACGDGADAETQRDMSFVRYELQVEAQDDSWVTKVFYGRLEEILVCKLPEDLLWGYMSGKTRLLAVITPCSTMGKDATKEITFHTYMTTPIVTDIRTIIAVIGRVETRGEWSIIDRSAGLLHPEFATRDDD